MRSVGSGVGTCAIPVLAVGAGTAIALTSREGDSGVRGRVVPCGIVLERAAPCAVAAKPAGAVAAGQRDRVLRRAKVRADGSFGVRLDPGRYWLQVRSGGRPGPRVRATVAEGEWTTVTLVAGRVAPPLDERRWSVP